MALQLKMVHKKFLISFAFILILTSPLISSEDWGYDYLDQGEKVDYGRNYTINTNSSDYWNTGDHGALRNVADILHNWLDSASLLWSNAGHTIDTEVEYNNNGIKNVGESNFSGRVNITTTDSNVDISALQIKTTNALGAGSQRFLNAEDNKLVIGVFSQTISNFLFPQLVSPGEAVGGLTMDGGPIFIVSQENKTIEIGSTPTKDITLTDFFLRFDPLREGITFQGDKHIQPKVADGGQALVFDSEDILSAGGFPFVFEAQDSNNETVILSFQQNGANNSFSGNMNSYVLYPKSWTNYSNPGMNTDNVTFLFNTSNYIQLCSWLQNELDLIPEGCKYFADTIGRKVPLFAAGDGEFWRTLTVHEGALVYNDFDFIGREGNDFNMLFNGEDMSGKLHIVDKRRITANITNFDRVIANFNDGTISPFVSESIAPEVGRDWISVNEEECHEDRCGHAAGGNLKVMCFSDGTEGAEDINISFYLTTSLSGLDSFDITIDNNEGTSQTIFTETATVVDEFNSFIMPVAYENKSNVTTCFELDAVSFNREVWVDVVRVQATFNPAREIDNPYDGGSIVLGEDGIDACEIYKDQYINNDTLLPTDRLNLKCNTVNLIGNVTQTDVEEVSINVTTNVTANNFIAREQFCFESENCVSEWWDVNKTYVDANDLWEVDGTETQLKTADEIDMQSKKILNLLNGTASTDAVNLGQMEAGDLWEMNSGDITNKNGEDVKVLFNNSKSISFQLMNDEPSIVNTHPTRIYQGGSLTAYFSSAGSFIYQNLGMRSKKIRDLAQGTISTDAVNKFQLDQVEDQLEWDCNQTAYGVECELKKTGGNQMILLENLTIEGDLEMGNYDANVADLKYDTLTAKSPNFLCSEEIDNTKWCSIIIPKYSHKELRINFNLTNYNILDIWFNDESYTKSRFNSEVCSISEKHGDICSRVNKKIKEMQDKAICKNQGYQWDGECFNIVISKATYNESVESYEKEIMNQTISNCTQLNSQLQVEEVECVIEVPTETFETIYRFKNGCSWTLENGYECKERVVV